MSNNSISKRIYLLRKMISILEWDIPHIKNKDLKLKKEEELNQYKKELNELNNEESITKLG